MSKLLKERIIYITSIALGLLTVLLLFVPFMSSNITETVDGVQQSVQTVYNGFGILFSLGVTGGYEIEGMMLLLMVIISVAALASIVWGGLAILNNVKNPEKFFGKKFFILFQLTNIHPIQHCKILCNN